MGDGALGCEALPQRVRRPKRVREPPAAAPARDAGAAAVDGGGMDGVGVSDGDGGGGGRVEGEVGGGGGDAYTYDDLETRENVHLTAGHRERPVGDYKFEYLDHTADIQLHSWGATLEEAFAQNALAMYNYMTPLKGITVEEERELEAEGHDMHSLLFAFLDECLFLFTTEFFVPKELTVQLDRAAWKVRAIGRGETFDRMRHVSGTEVKAITYSAMQVHEKEGDAEIFTIVDI